MQTLTDINDDQHLVDFEKLLNKILHSMSGRLGEDFLAAFVQTLCENFELDYAIIGRWKEDQETHLDTLAVYGDHKPLENFIYELTGTPCEVTKKQGYCCIAENAQTLFPQVQTLVSREIEGYLSVSLTDTHKQSIGALIILTHQPLKQIKLIKSVLQIFAYRVASELERKSIIQNLIDEVSINQALLDSAPALMFMIDQEGRFLRWNRYYLTKFGYSASEMLHHDSMIAVHELDRKRVELEIKNIFETGNGVLFINGVTKKGDVVPLLTTALVSQYEGKPVIVGVAMDMTEQQEVEHNLLRSQGRLARKNSQLSLMNTLVEKLHVSHSVKHIARQVIDILETVEEGAMLAFSVVNPAGKDMTVMASSNTSDGILQARGTFSFGELGSPTGIAMLSRQMETFPNIKRDNRISTEIKKLFEQENVKSLLVIPLYYQGKALGAITIGFTYNSEFPKDEKELFQTVGTSISLALANARQFERLENLATIDNLTGLPNRNALNQDCLVAIKENSKNKDCLGLVLIDLDRFKEINDTLDHQIGDKLLSLIGPRIKNAIGSLNSRIYRLGGDEFCVLIAKKDNAKQVTLVAEKISKALEDVFVIDGLNLEISSSIGVLTTKGHRYDPSEMLRCVELAMYHAKNSGGGIEFYTPELDADTEQRFVIMAEMAEAIRNDDLVLHYQPKYDLRTQKIIGCEALVRWQHKQYGLLPPDKFIPLIELTQLIHPLTYWVMKTAMAQLQQWKLDGLKLSVAVNLSTRNLTDDEFLKQVDGLMNQYDIQANEIEFEVTETALVSNLDRAARQLDAFKKRSIQCSLDDYGTGYSSLSYVKKMPLDILKIDRSFITQMLGDKNDSIIAKSTIDLAHNLGMKVIAEGVEDQITMQELTEQGCDMVQGYFICEPVTAEKFSELYWQYLKNPKPPSA
jgi:diguanylate cyclase (GGDEF)-like protein/PAS domain S-box-containing protein